MSGRGSSGGGTAAVWWRSPMVPWPWVAGKEMCVVCAVHGHQAEALRQGAFLRGSLFQTGTTGWTPLSSLQPRSFATAV